MPRLRVRENSWLYDRAAKLATAPAFCPLCGRPLEFGSWSTVDGEARYEYLCCFGGSWLAPLHRRLKITEPQTAHYLYDLGRHDFNVDPAVMRFDRNTGAPTR